MEAGNGGVSIGDAGCFLKAGKGGVLIAMANPNLKRATKISRVGDDGIEADQWYKIEVDTSNSFLFTKVPSPPEWITPRPPCIVPQTAESEKGV